MIYSEYVLLDEPISRKLSSICFCGLRPGMRYPIVELSTVLHGDGSSSRRGREFNPDVCFCLKYARLKTNTG